MTANAEATLGIGRYSPSEAARYARVSTQKLSRWIYGTSRSQPVFEPELGRDGDRVVTFLDFAQALSVYEVRLAIGIPLQKIRKAYQQAQAEHETECPLAVEHGLFIFGDLERPESCELGIYLPRGDAGDEREYAERAALQLTGRKKGNRLITRIVQPFSRNLIFSLNGIASAYVAFAKHGHRIIMDPEVRFGKPYLEGVGYEAETLSTAFDVEGEDVERVARFYRVNSGAVKAALEYRELLRTTPTPTTPKRLVA